MALLSVASPVPVVVRVVSSGPSWLSLLLSLLGTFLAGTATALLIQLYIVPVVETRKRREDRWERDVLKLGELLVLDLTNRANQAHHAQLALREARAEQTDDYNPALVAQRAREAQEATQAYKGLYTTQVRWFMLRVMSIKSGAREFEPLRHAIGRFEDKAAPVMVLPEDDNRPDTDWKLQWTGETGARQVLISEIIKLVELVPLRRC